MFQSLESRRLFAAQVGFSNGLVTVTGSDTLRDEVVVRYTYDSNDKDILEIEAVQRDAGGKILSTVKRTFDQAGVTGVKVDVRGGADHVIVEEAPTTTRPVTVLGGSGNDVIETSGAVFAFADGGSGNDTISGARLVRGGTGDDNIGGSYFSGPQSTGNNDTLLGESGKDTINGIGGTDYIDGGVGDDVIDQQADYWGSPNLSRVFGGDGNDTVTLTGSFDEIRGGYGNDKITVHAFFGEDGEEEAQYHENVANRGDVYGEGDSDTITLQSLYLFPGEQVRVFGGSHNDTLVGSSKGDHLVGGQGGDVIDGRGGNDAIYGETGNDKLTGGTGNDSVYGGTGYDVLTANDGQKDVLDGGADGIADKFIKDLLDSVVG